jgi:aromatic ring-cleaving dioxygenase
MRKPFENIFQITGSERAKLKLLRSDNHIGAISHPVYQLGLHESSTQPTRGLSIRISTLTVLIHPFGNKNIRIPAASVVAVAAPDEHMPLK